MQLDRVALEVHWLQAALYGPRRRCFQAPWTKKHLYDSAQWCDKPVWPKPQPSERRSRAASCVLPSRLAGDQYTWTPLYSSIKPYHRHRPTSLSPSDVYRGVFGISSVIRDTSKFQLWSCRIYSRDRLRPTAWLSRPTRTSTTCNHRWC